MTYDKHFSRKQTPQSQKAHKDQVKNSAGGYSFAVDTWTQLDRFLILGAEGGTYYIGEKNLVLQNVGSVEDALNEDYKRAVDTIVDVSVNGRAFKQEPTLFALALAASHENAEVRKYALSKLNLVARTGTHLFMFAKFVSSQRGWGRALKRTIADWYMDKDIGRLALQLIKYQQREGWSHRDLLRLSHPKTDDVARNELFKFAVSGDVGENVPAIVKYHAGLREDKADVQFALDALEVGVPQESLPTEFKKDTRVNKTLLRKMPYMAMVRNLGRLTANGTIKAMTEDSKYIVSRILDEEAIKKSRIHPMHLYLAYKTYKQGRGMRGSLSWTHIPQVTDALEQAFYKSFKYAESTGKNFYLGIDVSCSMTWGVCAGADMVTPMEGATALALTIAKTEPNYVIRTFSDKMVDVALTANSDLDQAYKALRGNGYGGTDCAQPMLDALKQGLFVDTFIVLTDNETWHGHIHPHEALVKYRNKVNPEAKLIVVGMQANRFSIANPNDAGMLDVVGFDASLPQLITEFSK